MACYDGPAAEAVRCKRHVTLQAELRRLEVQTMPVAYVHVRGAKTFLKGLAFICCRLVRYINKHRAKLEANMTAYVAAGGTPAPMGESPSDCLDSLLRCAAWICSSFMGSEDA